MGVRGLAIALAGAAIISAVPHLIGTGAGRAAAAQPTEAEAPRISMTEFKRLYDKGGVVVLDVRGVDAYRQGHIRGALSAPLETVAARAGEWKDVGKPVVAYCS